MSNSDGVVRILADGHSDHLPTEIEPATVGIPFAAGLLPDPRVLQLRAPDGGLVPVQFRPLERWADGSVRWGLLDFQLAPGTRPSPYELTWTGSGPAPVPPSMTADEQPDGVCIDTGAARFVVKTGRLFPFAEASIGGRSVLDAVRSRFSAEDEQGRQIDVHIDRVTIDESGGLRTVVLATGSFRRDRSHVLDVIVRLHFFAGLTTVRAVVTVRNPRPASHPGGFWELGGQGSVLLKDLSLTLAVEGDEPAAAHCSVDPGHPLVRSSGDVEIYQDSSGGDNWASRVHVNRLGQVPVRVPGYQLRDGGGLSEGRRATPHLGVSTASRSVSVTLRQFWQNCPKAMEAGDGAVVVRLWPRRYADLHELQGGEQKTHVMHIDVGIGAVRPLTWCRRPSSVKAEPSWYAAASAVPYLSPAEASDPRYLRLIQSAVEGTDSFEQKRERIDEYGWRNFGDLYADHEGTHYAGPEPVISHYNNQYDAVLGFTTQFMRTGDERWRGLADDLAAHVVDIDTYHTDGDKAAYNHAMFWHTCHYVDAGGSSHRSYPQAPGVGGGGPSNEHNYTTGLTLHHLMTGDPLSRETVIGFAEWVVAMDDGSMTPFRWLARGDTGLASQTRLTTYQGPGRGAGYSIRALLDGYRLTSDERFLAKAEQLIRRTIHPSDALEDGALLDREQRWSYTAYLQALGRYLDHKVELGRLDGMYAYARQSLLHYARWMQQHEFPYLDRPDQLEYPTETWVAQDVRKSEVFDLAARHAPEPERSAFLERAAFFWRYTVDTLAGMPSHTLTRPMVLMLGHGLLRDHMVRCPDDRAAVASVAATVVDSTIPFEPQRVRAQRRFKWLTATAASLCVSAAVWWLKGLF